MKRQFFIPALTLALSALAAPGQAQVSDFGDWQQGDITRAVPGHAGLTYLDLLKQLIPDLKANEAMASGHLGKPLRLLDGTDSAGAAAVRIGALQMMTVKAHGRSYLTLLADLGNGEDLIEQPTLLALFDDGQVPKLLDAVDIATDKLSGFAGPARVDIGPDDQAIITASQHFNSSESYLSTSITFVHNDRLQLLDTVWTYGVRTCYDESAQAVSVTATADGKADPYYPVTVTIRDRRGPAEFTCDDPKPRPFFDNRVSTDYRFDPVTSAFKPATDALEKLQQETSDRM